MTTYERVVQIVSAHTGAEHIVPTDTFGDIGADSLDVISMTLDFEKEFDIEIPDNAAINSVQDAVNFIEGHP